MSSLRMYSGPRTRQRARLVQEQNEELFNSAGVGSGTTTQVLEGGLQPESLMESAAPLPDVVLGADNGR